MLGLFLNSLTVDDKYSPLNRHTIYSNIFGWYSLRNKTYFREFFLFFRNLDSVLNLSKLGWPSQLMYFWTYGLRNSPVSVDSPGSNIVNRTKHYWNLNYSTLTIFIDPCERNSVWKSLSELYAKSYDCFLTHWLPITGILFKFWTFSEFSFSFSKFRVNFEHFEIKDDSHSWCTFELTDSEKRGSINV